MTRARTNANVTAAVGRNMIINGAMNVAQKSASVTGLGANANSTHTVDRWKTNLGSTAGRFTMTQTADGPNGISANCLKLDCTTADTSIAAGEAFILHQPIEGQNLQRIGKGVAGAKQITASFYVKASAAFTFALELFDEDNSRQISKLFTTTTDWVRHEFTIAADVDDGSSPFDDDNAISLDFNFWIHAGTTFTGGTLNTAAFANNTNANRAVGIDSFFSSTDNNFFLTGVQLEVGPVATEFEQEDIGVTLAKCQRYFHQIQGNGSATTALNTGLCNSTTIAFGYIKFPVTMRSAPTLSGSSGVTNSDLNSYTIASSAVAIANADKTGGFLSVTVSSGLTALRVNASKLTASTGSFIAFTAEL